jgi:site-specific recombinase XerD
MKSTASGTVERRPQQDSGCWPRKVEFNREIVRVYRRKTPAGNFAFMVANAAGEKRRFDCYASEADAIEAAQKLAERLSKRHSKAAAMTEAQAVEYLDAIEALKDLEPLSVSLRAAVSKLVEAVKIVGSLPAVTAAALFYSARHKRTTAKRVADAVEELLAVKEGRSASTPYLKDLRTRLQRFAGDFQKEIGNVTTAEVQAWLDGLKLTTQGYTNYRRVLNLLFEFAVARGYAADNPTKGTERVKVRNGEIEIYKPVEITRLLEAARVNFPDFLPCIALGALAGLRSAEIERLEWSDIDLAGRLITVGASKAKTASRRIVPINDSLAAWLAPYANRRGRIWASGSILFYKHQEATAAATTVEADPDKDIPGQAAVEWKSNALRHSYASYRFAQTGDAGRVAGELGNSAAVVHRHYRELVKPADAERWFNIKPEQPANVVAITAAAK